LQNYAWQNSQLSSRIRRPGGGRTPKIETEPGLLEALTTLVQSAIRGDPEAALLGVSSSQRHLAGALAALGFTVGQKLVGRLLRRPGFSLPANSKTREGTSHPDRNAQFEYINARINVFQAVGQPTISVDTTKKELVGGFKEGGRELRPKGDPEPVRVHDFAIPALGKVRRTVSTTAPPIPVGSTSASRTIPPPARWRASVAGGRNWERRIIRTPSNG
jgi:hypothetical protein